MGNQQSRPLVAELREFVESYAIGSNHQKHALTVLDSLEEQQQVYEENLKAYQHTILGLKEQLDSARAALDRGAKDYVGLLEQLEAAQRERSRIAQRARSFFIDYEDDCPHPVAMFLDDVSVDPSAPSPASEPKAHLYADSAEAPRPAAWSSPEAQKRRAKRKAQNQDTREDA